MGLGSRRRTEQDVLNGMGSMYTAIMFMGSNAASSVLPVVIAESAHFYRERKLPMAYSAVPYAVAQIVIEIPYTMAQAIIYVVIAYPMIDFQMNMMKFFL